MITQAVAERSNDPLPGAPVPVRRTRFSDKKMHINRKKKPAVALRLQQEAEALSSTATPSAPAVAGGNPQHGEINLQLTLSY